MLFKKTILIIIFLLVYNHVFTQNLIDNQGLESGTTGTPHSLLRKIKSTGKSPYWSAPKKHTIYGIYSNSPERIYGSGPNGGTPFEGEAFLRLLYEVETSFFGNQTFTNSYAVTELSSTLIKNHRYSYSYRLLVTNKSVLFFNKIGLMFSENHPEITKLKKDSELRSTGSTQQVFLDGGHQANLINDHWLNISGEFVTQGNNLNFLIIGHFSPAIGNCYIHFDDFELIDLGPDEEICDLYENVQDYTYTANKVHEAELELRSGFNVGAGGATGNVVVKPYRKVINKAGLQVTLEPGFETELGADFLAYIAPCEESPCDDIPPTGLANKTYDFCGSNGGIINPDFTFSTGGNFSWSPTTNLNNPGGPNPMFTPPAGNGVANYTVTYSNFCGVSATQQVTVNYSNMTTPPSLVVTNQIADEYLFTMDIQASNNNSEWIEITVKNKNTNAIVYTTNQLNEGVDFTNGFFNFEAPLYSLTSVCNDYEVEVTTKNVCNTTIVSQTFEWNRSTYCNPKPQLINTPTNFSPDGDGIEDEYCIEVCGADEYEVEFKDSFGTTVFASGRQSIINANFCIWDGGIAPSGSYTVDIKLYSCGVSYMQPGFSITLAR